MRPKSLLLLALALGCGLVASIGISQVLEARKGSGKPGAQTNICFALADIDRTEPVSADNAGLKPWPSDEVPAGAITKLTDAVGHRPSSRIVKGEPILMSKLGTGEGVAPAASEIPIHFRVVTVHVNNTENAGLILPGDRVDVQVFASKSPDVTQTSARTFLQDVSVFAVNSEIRNDKNKDDAAPKIEARTISLLVTPEQADLVTLASEMGKNRLIMRGTTPEKAVDHEPATVAKLFGGELETGSRPMPKVETAPLPPEVAVHQPVKPAAPVEEDFPRMTVIAGTEVRIAEFRKGELMPHWLPVDGANWPAAQSGPGADSGPEKPAIPDKEQPHDKQPAPPATNHGHSS